MGYEKYLEMVMHDLSNIVYNSQWESTKKEDIVSSLINIIDEYNRLTSKDIRYRL